MKPSPRSFVACFVIFGVAAISGCGLTRDYAFRVDGEEVSQSSVDDELRAISENEKLPPSVSQRDGTLSSEITALWVTQLVQQEVIDRLVRRRDVEETDADRATARREASRFFGDPEVFDGFPRWFRQRIVERFTRRVALVRVLGGSAGPSDEDVRARYEEILTGIKESCASGKFAAHILVETRPAADDLVARLASGADFAELAREESIDQQTAAQGGELLCFDPAQVDPQFAAAAQALSLGQVSEPVQTQFGFHLIRMSDTIPFESVEAVVREQLESESGGVTSPELDDRIAEARVRVDPRYGRWVVRGGEGRVQPPRTPVATSSPPGVTATPAPAPEP